MKKEDVFFQFIANSELTQDNANIDLGRLKIILIDRTLPLLKAKCCVWGILLKLILMHILVSYSVNGLDKCIRATHEYQQFNKNIEEEMKVKGPVLRREDFDATKFRTVSANFQELHPSRLVKEGYVQILTAVKIS